MNIFWVGQKDIETDNRRNKVSIRYYSILKYDLFRTKEFSQS